MSCKCYHADRNFIGKIGVCWGTKECEPCSCNGDEAKCDFYDYVRNRARKDKYMGVYAYYDNEVNYIAKQIKTIFNFHAVFVEYNPKAMWYIISFVGHPLLTYRRTIINLEELRTASYLLILKRITDFLIDEMKP